MVSENRLRQAIPKGGSWDPVKVFQRKYQVDYTDQDFPVMTPEPLSDCVAGIMAE